jgi:hypothetical protein
LRATLATPLRGGIGKRKALAREKERLGALRAGWGGILRAVGIISIKEIVGCSLAWDKAHPRAKSLSWQTQGGRVK